MEQVTPRRLQAWLEEENLPIVIDVRDHEYFIQGSLPHALSWPDDLFIEYARNFHKKNGPCVVVCAAYEKAVFAALQLERYGFKKVFVLIGGISSWERRFGPLNQP